MSTSAKEGEIGRIHSLESFSTVDGPGIRFVVFMQGCPLRCIYCQNPDTWKYGEGTRVTIDEIFDQIKSQVGFLSKDEGGITVSGGEPLAQAPFVARLFKKIKDELGITTAIDTSGCIPISPAVEDLIKVTDYILIDVKHVDSAKHVVLTGRSTGLIRTFIDYIQSQTHLKIWIRHVVVPGYTTSDEDVDKIAQYLAGISLVQRIELLPYHEMGEYKWELIERDYKLKDIEPPTKEEILKIEARMREFGIQPQSIYTETT